MSKTRVYIDCENVSSELVDSYLDICRTYGDITTKKAYGDFSNGTLKPWKEKSQQYGLKLEQVVSSGKGKSTSDMKLMLDLVSEFYENRSDSFVLVSNDSDFYHAAILIKEKNGMIVNINTGTGNAIAIRNNFVKAHTVEVAKESKKVTKKAKQDKNTNVTSKSKEKKTPSKKEILALLDKVINELKNKDGYADFSKVMVKLYSSPIELKRAEIKKAFNITSVAKGKFIKVLKSEGKHSFKKLNQSYFIKKGASKPKPSNTKPKENKTLSLIKKAVKDNIESNGFAKYSVVVAEVRKKYTEKQIKANLKLSSYSRLREYLGKNGFTVKQINKTIYIK